MEYDAEIIAIGTARLSKLAVLKNSGSFAELTLLFPGGGLSGLSGFGLDFQDFIRYSWNPSQYRLQLEFIHSQAHSVCEVLFGFLIGSGFKSLEAFIYSDECECVVDDDGVVHRLGERMYIDGDGRLMAEDYPQVEYNFI